MLPGKSIRCRCVTRRARPRITPCHQIRALPAQPKMRFTSTSSSRSYDEALDRLTQLQSNRSVTQGFETNASDVQSRPDPNAAAIPEMLLWLWRAGYTPKDLSQMRHIHVAGTKGKGSVCAYATSALRQYRGGSVGTYTSPHLVSPRERIALDGEPIGQDAFAAAFFELWDRFTEAARREGRTAADAEGPASKPFFFRFLTILAWHVFLQSGVRDVVMECGIGGEYDATNVLPPEAVSAAVVTQLGIDHVAMLGGTVEEIAWHKAGIFKPGVTAFTRCLDTKPNVMEVLRTRAKEKGAELVELDDRTVDAWGGVEGSLRGDFRKHNQALAAMAVQEHLGLTHALQDLPAELVRGLREAKLRGRSEVLEVEGQLWHLDGSHTTNSLNEVAKWFIEGLGADESAVLIFNQQERDLTKLLTGFINTCSRLSHRQDMFSHVFFTTNELTGPAAGQVRDLSPQLAAAAVLKEMLPGTESDVFDNARDAVAEAKGIGVQADRKRKVLATGSMHLVGAVMRTLEPQSLL